MWKWFQKTYNKIDNMKWSPKMAVTIQKINDQIPKTIRVAILNYIKTKYEVSEELAIESLKDLKKKLDSII